MEYLANITIVNDVTNSIRFTVEITGIQFPIQNSSRIPSPSSSACTGGDGDNRFNMGSNSSTPVVFR